MLSEEEVKIIHAPRDNSFKEFIRSLLQKADLDKMVIKVLLKPRSLKLFADSFTHESANEEHNYQFNEKFGDTTVNKSIRTYITYKFPKLQNKEGVEYISELESKWKSTEQLSRFANDLGFKEFISADEERLDKNIRATSEDVFEAFVGALEMNIDREFDIGEGYCTCYKFMERLLNTINISYTYEQLINSKSRINELILGMKNHNLKLKYVSNKNVEDAIFSSKVYIVNKETKSEELIGDSNNLNRLDVSYQQNFKGVYRPPFRKKVVSEKAAAEVAIYNLIIKSESGDEILIESVKKMRRKRNLCPFSK